MTERESAGAPRILSLDALRGLAVLLMVHQHLGVWLWEHSGRNYNLNISEYSWYINLNLLGALAAPVFIMLAGVGTVFFVSGQLPTVKIDRVLLVRGLFVLLCGYLLNLICPHWFSIGSWYVLHCIGACLMLTPLFRRLSDRWLILLALVFVAGAVLLQTWLNTPLYLTNERMGDISLAGGVMRLALAEGQFPLFPWLAFFVTGIQMGRWITRRRDFFPILLSLALFTIAILSAISHWRGYPFATYGVLYRFFVPLPNFFPPLPPFMLLLMGFAVLLVANFSRMENNLAVRVLAPSGRISLTILILHAFLFNTLFRAINLYGSFSAGASCTIIVLMIALFIGGAHLWKRFDFRFSIEWAMRKISG